MDFQTEISPLAAMGGIPFTVDGKPIDWHETVTYRGAMFTGVPNMAWVMRYFRASWTLRVEMVSEFVCKLLMRSRPSRHPTRP